MSVCVVTLFSLHRPCALWQQRNHANFQASLRLPLLQCLHVIMNAFISICVAARQVMSVHGLGAFPCILMDVASMLACTSYLFTHWVTGIHFLVLFDPARRKRFIRFVMPDVLIPIYVAVFLLGIAFGIISSLSRYNFCLHGYVPCSPSWPSSLARGDFTSSHVALSSPVMSSTPGARRPRDAGECHQY